MPSASPRVPVVVPLQKHNYLVVNTSPEGLQRRIELFRFFFTRESLGRG